MKPIDDLIVSGSEDAWPQVLAWQSASPRSVEILECSPADGQAALLAAQVSTRSPMGAIALHCGGISIDGGWLRLLGAGCDAFGGLREWNERLGGASLAPPVGDALLVAFDALGGWFAINGGRWPDELGGVRYLTPDASGWQALELGYSGLLQWAMSGDLDRFHEGHRWPGWQSEVASLGPDEGLAIYPPLGFDKTPVSERSRRPVPLRELWTFHHDLAAQVADLPNGGQVEFRVADE